MSTSALAGQHAVVTGGGSGIGAAIAAAFARADARVTLMGRDPARLAEQRQVLGTQYDVSRIQTVHVDVSQQDAVNVAFAEASTGFGTVDILVNNAGQAQAAPFLKTDAALWRAMLDVNLSGVFFCTQAVLPAMLERCRGRVVNIASTAGLVGYAYVAAYCAAKHGVIGLTRALALEVARKGITVNAVCPGYTETALLQESLGQIISKTSRSEDEARESLLRANPQHRFVSPVEVAEAVLWLCQPNSGAMNGQSISVSGGEVM